MLAPNQQMTKNDSESLEIDVDKFWCELDNVPRKMSIFCF